MSRENAVCRVLSMLYACAAVHSAMFVKSMVVRVTSSSFSFLLLYKLNNDIYLINNYKTITFKI